MKIYIAAPLFNVAERDFNERIDNILCINNLIQLLLVRYV